MNRITQKDLETLCNRINQASGAPLTSWETVDGRRTVAHIGNHHLAGAYGGWQLRRMVNTDGGIAVISNCGYAPRRKLYNCMHCYLAGINANKGE